MIYGPDGNPVLRSIEPGEIELAGHAIAASLSGRPAFALQFDPVVLFSVIGALQLALLHPEMNDAASEIVRSAAEDMGRALAGDSAVLAEAIAMGWDRQCDELGTAELTAETRRRGEVVSGRVRGSGLLEAAEESIAVKAQVDAAYMAYCRHVGVEPELFPGEIINAPDLEGPLAAFAPEACPVCGCTEAMACPDDGTGNPCHWVAVVVCSSCAASVFGHSGEVSL